MSNFTTLKATKDLLKATEVAITNMIKEVKKPPEAELSGSARKAELQSIKMVAVDCKEMLAHRMELEKMIKDLEDTGVVEEKKDFGKGFAEAHAKK